MHLGREMCSCLVSLVFSVLAIVFHAVVSLVLLLQHSVLKRVAGSLAAEGHS